MSGKDLVLLDSAGGMMSEIARGNGFPKEGYRVPSGGVAVGNVEAVTRR